LRRARERLEVIKRQIEEGTFSFADEFPDYRFLPRLRGLYKVRVCNDVFDEYLPTARRVFGAMICPLPHCAGIERFSTASGGLRSGNFFSTTSPTPS
jgi:hypothetical protein